MKRALLRGSSFRPGPLLSIAFAAGLVVSLLFLSLLLRGQHDGPPRAVIVDQLSLTHPNPSFVREASRLLEEAGFLVDYYPGEAVTVALYQSLASRGYDYVLLRNHSALIPDYALGPEGPLVRGDVGLFTSEPASASRYLKEQRTFRLTYGRYFEGGPRYFSVGSRLIASSSGEFDGATVVIMGCNGLTYPVMAGAFLERGAEEVIGWTDLVSAAHTDAATERFLRYHLGGGFTAREAVARTMDELGRDPGFGSELVYYR